MRGRVIALVAALAAVAYAGCLGGTGVEAKFTRVDATGVAVSLDDTSRIVATSHDLVEIFFLLGEQDRLVGVPSWLESASGNTHFPYDLGDRARLGRPHVLDAEEVIALGPSLVLEKDHPLQPTPLATKLRAAGIPVFVFDNTETIQNIHDTISTVGAILAPHDAEVETKARALSEQLRADERDLNDRLSQRAGPTPRALYQLPAGIVAGAGTSANLLLQLAGATNIAARAGIDGYKQVSRETIIDADPERVVASATAAGSARTFFGNPRYTETTAARLGPETLRIVDPLTTALVGPGFIAGARDIAMWLHPDAFEVLTGNLTSAHADNDTNKVTFSFHGTIVAAPPLHYRLDPGDGSNVVESTEPVLTHAYTSPGTYTARFLTIDNEGRVLSTHIPLIIGESS